MTLKNWNAALTGGKIVPLADYTLMSTPQKASDGSDTGYGFGLFVTSVDGQPRIGHTGGSFGFTAANFYFPRQNVRIIALTNNADVPEAGEMLTTAVFNDLFPATRASSAPASAQGEDAAVTAKARAGFEHLQKGLTDASLLATTLQAKLKAGLDQRMAHQFGPDRTPTAFIFKGHRSEGGKQRSDYLIAFGPGSTLKFSVALGDSQEKSSASGSIRSERSDRPTSRRLIRRRALTRVSLLSSGFAHERNLPHRFGNFSQHVLCLPTWAASP